MALQPRKRYYSSPREFLVLRKYPGMDPQNHHGGTRKRCLHERYLRSYLQCDPERNPVPGQAGRVIRNSPLDRKDQKAESLILQGKDQRII